MKYVRHENIKGLPRGDWTREHKLELLAPRWPLIRVDYERALEHRTRLAEAQGGVQ